MGLRVLLRFGLTLAGHALGIKALFSRVGFAFGVGFGEFLDRAFGFLYNIVYVLNSRTE